MLQKLFYVISLLKLSHGQLFFGTNFPTWTTTSNLSTMDDDAFKSVADSKLILTRYIRNGELWKARKFSRVDPEPFLNVTSFSGYLTVNETHNSNLWFWFFPAETVAEYYKPKPEEQNWGDDFKSTRNYDDHFRTENNLKDMPLLLWLQGGPGSSSLFGLFTENGPFFINEDEISVRGNNNLIVSLFHLTTNLFSSSQKTHGVGIRTTQLYLSTIQWEPDLVSLILRVTQNQFPQSVIICTLLLCSFLRSSPNTRTVQCS